ncbi:MAG TPA: TadE/TadG family type IV pilus assembly protein [Chloroflexota bacterium]|nr:TadE/TadG family type IV pilus assembly protein [Chloroflexota bacterium]
MPDPSAAITWGLQRWRRLRLPAKAALERGSALVETAIVMPVLLVLVFGLVGIGRIIQADLGVIAVAREAARSAAQANTASEAGNRGLQRGKDVAGGYQLANGSLQLTVDAGSFQRGGQVTAEASYEVGLTDLPLMQWTSVKLSSRHVEDIDPYRSRWPIGGSS